MSIALSVRNLSVHYPGSPGITAVSGIDLDIHQGEIVGLVGESGCGKSSIAGALMGILDNSGIEADQIMLGTRNLTDITDREYRRLRGRDISMIFQEPLTALDPVLSIGSQLGAVLRRHGIADSKNVASKSQAALQGMNLGDIPTILRSYPHQLSGGMRQRVMIGMAMACKPAILLADEPTTALDVTTQADVLQLLRKTGKENNTGVLLITHDLAVAAAICERIIVMRDGQFLEAGQTHKILTSPEHPYTVSLLDAVPRLSESKTLRSSPPNEEEILSLEHHSVSHLVRRKGKRQQQLAVDNVDLDIRRGEILALVGESGCGKSTLAHSLVGLKPTHRNSLKYSGHVIGKTDRTAWADLRRHVQLVFQDPRASLSPRRTIGKTLIEPLDHFDIDNPENRPGRVSKVLERVGLDAGTASKYPHELSGGQRQRVALARALISEPDLIVADEPLSSLDVSIQAKIIELILQLREELGFAVLIVSHDLAVVRQLADRVAVMCQGKIVELAEAKELFEHPTHTYTQGLLNAIPTFPNSIQA